MDNQRIIDATRRWIETMVIGLNLCPFAERVFRAEKIRYVVSAAEDEHSLLAEFSEELTRLAAGTDGVETTLLIHPRVLTDFLDYNDFLDRAENRIERLSLTGVIQVASFHPQYLFADSDPDAVENYTNRSTYPMLHMLREESIDQVGASQEELLAIPERNIARLNALGKEAVLQMIRSIMPADRNGD